ncbi:Kinesin-like protein KIN-10A [Castilleja foliolosa]|uniref:Kinesin-like protein KIN-10A n=2 Tax=Castilleja foliolosa TaxID=1961234 RepID=A0ABD3E7B8_9LAMI
MGFLFRKEDGLEGFYQKFVESRVNGVKVGQKCTVMMYGPTGSGKSHTMFGIPNEPGIVYKSLKGILGEGVDEDGERLGVGTFV